MKIIFLVIFTVAMMGLAVIPYSYAGCAATILPQPCFDAFMGSTEPLTEKSIMEGFARHIEVNHPDWQMSDRKWDDFDEKLELPAIICTEFVSDGTTQYRMAKWVDAFKISSFENHRNDWLCDKWLPPLDDGIKISWNQTSYLPDGAGTVQVIDKEMNLDGKKIDSFDMHVWSDVDHTGIQLAMTETGEDSGMFEGTVFFTTVGKSDNDLLLVEDAVHASHKENYGFSRIIDEYKTELEPNMKPTPDDFRESGNNANLLYAFSGLGLVGIVVGFFVIKKWRTRK